MALFSSSISCEIEAEELLSSSILSVFSFPEAENPLMSPLLDRMSALFCIGLWRRNPAPSLSFGFLSLSSSSSSSFAIPGKEGSLKFLIDGAFPFERENFLTLAFSLALFCPLSEATTGAAFFADLMSLTISKTSDPLLFDEREESPVLLLYDRAGFSISDTSSGKMCGSVFFLSFSSLISFFLWLSRLKLALKLAIWFVSIAPETIFDAAK
mmetsp:Transcript_17820/g.37031  ORF Transcript_17820/g.37031 Transcript_17820/m.37031 type:complete len:212 (-) Transcript_17820:2779-3414(-)